MTRSPEPPGDVGRRTHYAQFYGLRPLADDGRPVVVVHGNCQAESVRVVIDASSDEAEAVRIPPVHELTEDDLPHLRRLLAVTEILACQPVAPGYRGLPIGTDDLAALAPRARLVRWPVVRYVGLHPFAAIVRKPWRGDPPAVPYHDLRTILAEHRGLPAGIRPSGHGRPAGFRRVAAESVEELRRREREGALVPVSDLVEPAGAGAMHTVNHPGNAVLVPLAGRIMAAAGLADRARDPGRTLLPSIAAPLLPEVLEALGLPVQAADRQWRVGGDRLDDEAVGRLQRRWYRARPEVVDAALRRYASAIEALGL